MLDLAKQRVRVGKKVLPVVYARAKDAYEVKALAAMREQGFYAPREPWTKWSIAGVEMRRHNLLDPVEALSSLKWCVDSLVRWRYVLDDSLRELVYIAMPQQVIDRKNRGVTLHLMRLDGP